MVPYHANFCYGVLGVSGGYRNAYDKTWEEWVKRSGELSPDFDDLPSGPFLPDPLEGIRTPAQWETQRQQIRAQFEQWFYGKMPPAPDNLRAVVTSTQADLPGGLFAGRERQPANRGLR